MTPYGMIQYYSMYDLTLVLSSLYYSYYCKQTKRLSRQLAAYKIQAPMKSHLCIYRTMTCHVTHACMYTVIPLLLYAYAHTIHALTDNARNPFHNTSNKHGVENRRARYNFTTVRNARRGRCMRVVTPPANS